MNFSEVFFGALTLIGGLALFLYGMHIMGEGLTSVSGGRLERILERLTDNPLKAVLLGAGVTAVIQSSSATTVTVVGFVNSGIMKLGQAVGVIMGANVGTTVTSWLLSLTGLESSNFFLRLLKPSSFTPVMAMLGIILIMGAKTERRKDIGSILAGFAVLMFGMEVMSGAVEPLADVPGFTGVLTMFSHPLLGMLAGALLTAVVQSSSASVGILQALCATGGVSYLVAFPIIMGQNIGTCVTALLSSVGASRNARRAALVHLYFNVIGTAVFMIIFYSLNALRPFAFLEQSAGAAGIALIHTCFNVGATVMLLPFARGLEKLAMLTIREDKTETRDELANLDVRFLDTPALALGQCRRSAGELALLTEKNIEISLHALSDYRKEDHEELEEREAKIDYYEQTLTEYLHKIAGHSLLEKDSEELNMLLYCIRDFERIGDHSCNIMEQAERIHKKNIELPKKTLEELMEYVREVYKIVRVTTTFFVMGDEDSAKKVEGMEDRIDQINKQMKKRNMKRMKKEKYSPEAGIFVNELSINLERIADHCENIAICFLGDNDMEAGDI